MKKDLTASSDVSDLIDKLTNDEDMRQDLWLAYFNGLTPDKFQKHLKILEIKQSIQDNRSVHTIIVNGVNEDVVNYLLDLECLVVYLLLLNYDIGIISKYTGIDEVYINNLIGSLKRGCLKEKLIKSMDYNNGIKEIS